MALFNTFIQRKSKVFKLHRKNIVKASKELKKIKRLKEEGMNKEIFHLLRYKISPYVFEEMILTAFQQAGAEIKRSSSYSGDGGIDGEVIINTSRYLIQTKKYKGYIKAVDVSKHVKICNRKRAKGFFVHSGMTGLKSKDFASGAPIAIVSGDSLISLLAGRENLSLLAKKADITLVGDVARKVEQV
jgi:restriction system protein